MSYNKSPFKMAPKSPLTKALKGNQGKLPQHLQEAIKAAPGSPAKLTTDAAPTAKLKYNEADTSYEDAPGFIGPRRVKSKPTPKYDKELNTLVAARKGLKKGTSEYNTIQNQINAKLGSKKVHGRGTSTTTDLKSKEVRVVPKQEATTPKPAAQKPAAQKPAASKGPSQADKFENVLAKENAKAPMGSETGSKAPAKKPAAKQPVVAKKPVAKKPVAKKTVGQKVKGTVKKARLAQLDKKANRQEARAENKTARKTKRAEKLTARANKLTGK
jgi:hypothetical protein